MQYLLLNYTKNCAKKKSCTLAIFLNVNHIWRVQQRDMRNSDVSENSGTYSKLLVKIFILQLRRPFSFIHSPVTTFNFYLQRSRRYKTKSVLVRHAIASEGLYPHLFRSLRFHTSLRKQKKITRLSAIQNFQKLINVWLLQHCFIVASSCFYEVFFFVFQDSKFANCMRKDDKDDVTGRCGCCIHEELYIRVY